MAQSGQIKSSTFNGSCQYIINWEAVERSSTITRINITGILKVGSTLEYTKLVSALGNFKLTVYETETGEVYDTDNSFEGTWNSLYYDAFVENGGDSDYIVLTPNSTLEIGSTYLVGYDTTIDEYGVSQFWYRLENNGVTAPYFCFEIDDYGRQDVFEPELEGDIVLSAEPKVATIACPDAYIGDTVNIIVSNKSSTYRNTITYQFGSLSGTIVSDSSASSVSWTIPWEFLQEIPSGSSHATCTLTCTTVNPSTGNTIGTSTTTCICRMDVNMLAPTFNPVVEDINATTLALTGNSDILVKYYSTAQVTIGAEPQDDATVVTQYAENGGTRLYGEVVEFPNVESGTFTMVAIDNRTATSSTIVTKSMIDYSKLSCNIVEYALNAAGEVTFKAQGNYFNSSFGAVSNTLDFQYRYSIDGSTYTGWISANPTISGHNYTFETTLPGFDYRNTVNLQVQVLDKLMTVTSAEVSFTGKTVFDWGKDDFNFNVPVNLRENLVLHSGASIHTQREDGSGRNILWNADDGISADVYLNYGGYTEEDGNTNIYGNNINLIAVNDITVNGQSLLELTGAVSGDSVLWSGANLMGSGTTITLSDSISNQSRGVVLVFSLYRNGSAEDVSITTAFVSKKEVELLPGAPHTFLMAINAGLSSFGSKYLYIDDTTIEGHEGNAQSGTAASGITFANGSYVLRYVIGV